MLVKVVPAQHQPVPALQAAEPAAALLPDNAAGHSADAAESLRVKLHPDGAGAPNDYGLALLYARLGDRDNTLKHLQGSCDHHVPDLPSTRWDPACSRREDIRTLATAHAGIPHPFPAQSI
jgi:hypothetical protein